MLDCYTASLGFGIPEVLSRWRSSGDESAEFGQLYQRYRTGEVEIGLRLDKAGGKDVTKMSKAMTLRKAYRSSTWLSF